MPGTTKTVAKILFVLLISSLMAGCSGGVISTPEATATSTLAPTVAPPTDTPEPSPTPIPPTPTPIRTPPALPGIYQSSILNPFDTPVTYVAETCEYLKNRWDVNNSTPGTTVMVIMIHGVNKQASPDMPYNAVTREAMKRIYKHLAEVGYQTITMNEMADFMERNAQIPYRSVVFLVDDRHYAEYFTDNFIPYLQKYGWKTVTNAWISDVSLNPSIYPELQDLVNQGYLDMQSHGFQHNNNITNASSEDYIHQEIYKPKEVISEYFGHDPVAFIWPGGSFTRRGIEVAREAGYRLGFTVNPRGPVMYNWVPQAAQIDPGRPSYLPETDMGDPLMTLPRYWSTDALYRIDEVINIGDQARAEAAKNQATELEYYDIVCKEQYGPIPAEKVSP